MRHLPTSVTTTSATLKGTALSTTGGPGSYFIEYSQIPLSHPLFPKTPTRSVDFVVSELHPVSEPVDGLSPGRAYYYTVCAEDSENPGDPFCSPFQSLRTVGDSVAGSAVTQVFEDREGGYQFEIGSDPAGQAVSGFATQNDFVGRTAFGTPLCLLVRGNRAVIGMEWQGIILGTGPNEYLVIEDGGAGAADKLGLVTSTGPANDCSSVPSDVQLTGFGAGGIVVTDAQPQPSTN